METGPSSRLTAEPTLLRATPSHLPLLQRRMTTLGLAMKLVILGQGTLVRMSQFSPKDIKLQEGLE